MASTASPSSDRKHSVALLVARDRRRYALSPFFAKSDGLLVVDPVERRRRYRANAARTNESAYDLTDVAVESADVVLVRSDPRDVAAILGLSRATYRKMVQNLIWATAYNAVAIPMAAGITFGTGFMMTPAVAAVFMSASTVIVAINAQFLRNYRRKG